MSELKAQIANLVHQHGLSPYHPDAVAVADAILALPEIARALAIVENIKANLAPDKPLNLGHAISTGAHRDDDD